MKLELDNENWEEVYNGYGEVRFDFNSILLKPDSAASASETHAALVKSEYELKDFTLELTAITKKQLRAGSEPNPWEVFWIFFNYIPTDDGKKQTNYFLLKPNGYELGRASDELEQVFLATGTDMQLEIGEEYIYKIYKSGNHIEININGIEIINGDYDLYNVYGSIGLYCEDAEVEVSSVDIESVNLS